MKPKREIMNMPDMAKWKRSAAYTEYINFIQNLNDSVKGASLDPEDVQASNLPGTIVSLLNLIKKLSGWVDEVPPIQQPQRFGNKAFKTWLTKVRENAEALIREVLPESTLKDASVESSIDEIAAYLIDSFGNDTRIDYGTGHEMTFAMFLMCLYKAGMLKQEDSKFVVNSVFNSYLTLVRKLQTTYKMEPAGSHGVWSLDDFQFLPFIFGSSQLSDQARIEPRHFVEESYIEQNYRENMFFGCLKYITTAKNGPFAEHSNQLWNISSVPTWSKVNSGLIKMYKAEVLEKFPVVQHILFGSYISIAPYTHQ